MWFKINLWNVLYVVFIQMYINIYALGLKNAGKTIFRIINFDPLDSRVSPR